MGDDSDVINGALMKFILSLNIPNKTKTKSKLFQKHKSHKL